MSDPAYPWYATVEGDELSQGDVVSECPVFSPVPPADLPALLRGEATVDVDVLVHRMIVMTQACDLAQEKVDSVVLCPVWGLEELVAARKLFGAAREKDKLRQGVYPAYHMLNEYPPLRLPISVVDFHRLYTVPKDFLRRVAAAGGARARLLPPYREHLAQSFARYFMRVGLPVDIPKFA